jgi:hypothetical protein
MELGGAGGQNVPRAADVDRRFMDRRHCVTALDSYCNTQQEALRGCAAIDHYF